MSDPPTLSLVPREPDDGHGLPFNLFDIAADDRKVNGFYRVTLQHRPTGLSGTGSSRRRYRAELDALKDLAAQFRRRFPG